MNTRLGQVDFGSGGFYELELMLGDGPDNQVLQALLAHALRTLWTLAEIHGCYLDPARSIAEQEQVAPRSPKLMEHGTLYGDATFLNGEIVACGSSAYWQSDRDPADPVSLTFFLPLNALSPHCPVGGFPFDDHSHRSWRVPTESWLASIGGGVLKYLPKSCWAAIGFELMSKERNPVGFPDRDPSDQRSCGYLCTRQSKVVYFPRTTER